MADIEDFLAQNPQSALEKATAKAAMEQEDEEVKEDEAQAHWIVDEELKQRNPMDSQE